MLLHHTGRADFRSLRHRAKLRDRDRWCPSMHFAFGQPWKTLPNPPDWSRLSWPVWAILRQTWGTDSGHIESIHCYLLTRPRLPSTLVQSPPSCFFYRLSGLVHSFLARPHPPLSPFARLQACTYTLCRVILAGASCKSFLESQLHLGKARPWRRVAETLSRSRPFPQATHHPRFIRLSTFAPFAGCVYDPAGILSQLCSPPEPRQPLLWLEARCQDVSLSETCRNCATEPPGLRSGRSVLVQHPRAGSGHVHRIPIVDT